MLKYTGYTIAFQEVPNEISLVFNISGCTHHCKGCHSQYLWEDVGRDLSADIADAIRQYADVITCVCFMGGDQDQKELVRLANMCGGYKTCLYSGFDSLDDLKDCVGVFDYVTRIIGYLKRISRFSEARQREAAKRFYDGKVNI